MKRFTTILFLICGLGIFSNLNAQKWVPKIGINFADSDPSIESTVLNGKYGYMAGLEWRSNNTRTIVFNPGLYFTTAQYNAFAIDDSGNLTPNGQAKLKLLKLPVGIGVYLTDRERQQRLKLRLAFQPIISLGASYGDTIDPDTLKDSFTLDYLMGLGLELGRFIIDIDYELDLLKLVKEADKASNLISLGIGFTL